MCSKRRVEPSLFPEPFRVSTSPRTETVYDNFLGVLSLMYDFVFLLSEEAHIMLNKRLKGSVARMMVENRRQFSPRIVENKKRKSELRPKHSSVWKTGY